MAGDIFRLLRVSQWYKNIVIFIALFFTGHVFIAGELWPTMLGFVSLCLISSANYTINDIVDRKSDSLHPEKKDRPIASGRFPVHAASLLAFFLVAISVLASSMLSAYFMLTIAGLFILSLAYTLYLKDIMYIDIILISINFVLRAISGAFIINVDISPWLLVCAFFLSQFMVLGKRRSDLAFLGKDASRHRKVFRHYSVELLDQLITADMAILMISYALYTFLKGGDNMIYTLPIVLYGLYRYHYLISSGSDIPRQPEKLAADPGLALSILAWGLILFVLLYVI